MNGGKNINESNNSDLRSAIWGLNKMVAILETTFPGVLPWMNENSFISTKISVKCVSDSLIDYKAT